MRLVSWTLAGPGTAPIIGDALRSVAPVVDACVVVWTGPDALPHNGNERLPPDWILHPGDEADAIDAALDALHESGPYLRWTSWPWRDHFGDARNAGLDFAADVGADWSCMLDTDERVICPDPAALRSFLATLPPDVCVVVAYAADGSHGRERLFRLPAHHRWVGRTHEAFPVDVGEQAIVPPSIITWDELPKSAEQLRAKNERDAKMIAAEIEARPDDARWRFYMGGALSGLDRHDEAIEAYRECANRSDGEDGALACVRAATLLHEQGRYAEAVAACARGMTMRADIAELPWIAAGASYNAGNVYQAEAFARLAMVHGEAGPGRDALDRRVGFRVPHALRDGPAEVLRLVARARGRETPPLVPDPNPVRITVTSSAINAEFWAERCIRSVATQGHEPRSHVYVAADRGTYASAKCEWTGNADVVDGQGRGLLANLLPIWRCLPDDDVIVWLDGDDWLAHDHALDIVAKAHAAGALVTYGQYITSDGQIGLCAQGDSDPRSGPWRYSHLKTFRAGLVKRIRDEDLRRADGEYLDLAIDQAIMIPCVEMAAERAVYVPRVLAVYNTSHSFHANASPEDRAREDAEVARIRRMKRYARV